MILNRVTRILAGLAACAILGAGSALADCRKNITLTASGPGISTDVSGTVEVRASGARQRFKLSMDARVADGTVYVVQANGQPAGTVTIVAGDGQLELSNDNGKTLPAAVNPVCSVGTVLVIDGQGLAVLSGSF